MKATFYLIIFAGVLAIVWPIVQKARRKSAERELVELTLKPGAGINIRDNERTELMERLRK